METEVPGGTGWVEVALRMPLNQSLCFNYFVLEPLGAGAGGGISANFTGFLFIIVALLACCVPLVFIFRPLCGSSSSSPSPSSSPAGASPSSSPAEASPSSSRAWVSPLKGPNFLEHEGNRWVPVCILAAAGQTFFFATWSLIFEGRLFQSSTGDLGGDILNTFYSMMLFLFFGFIYWPLYLSFEYRETFEGSIVGIISTSFMFAYRFSVGFSVASGVDAVQV